MARTLYKYTKAEYIDSILKNGGMIKLSSPSSFNDPHDCYFGVDKNNLERSFRMILNVAFICEYRNDPSYINSKSFQLAYNMTAKSVKLSHIYDENPAINAIINEYLKTRPNLSDYIKSQRTIFDSTFKNIIYSLREDALIASLSEEALISLMWSHYANEHRGICVEYEIEDEKELSKVIYTDNPNNFDLYTVMKYVIPVSYFGENQDLKNDPKFLSVSLKPFLRKAKEWSYEKEVRMIFSATDKKKIIKQNNVWLYPGVKVKSIYLGCKISEKDKQSIESKCKALNIPVHHVSIKRGNSKLFLDD